MWPGFTLFGGIRIIYTFCLPSLACLVFVNFIPVVACSCGLIFITVEHSIVRLYHCV